MQYDRYYNVQQIYYTLLLSICLSICSQTELPRAYLNVSAWCIQFSVQFVIICNNFCFGMSTQLYIYIYSINCCKIKESFEYCILINQFFFASPLL